MLYMWGLLNLRLTYMHGDQTIRFMEENFLILKKQISNEIKTTIGK